MKRFQNVLVYPSGLNRGDPAVATAADLAKRTGARLAIVWVLDPSAAELDVRRQRRDDKLHALTDELTAAGVSARPLLLEGDKPSKVLANQVRQDGFDLVIKAARPGDQERDHAFSETAKRLLRDGACPVWIVRTPPPDSPTRILAAISPYHHQDGIRELDRNVLEVARQLADVRQAELNVVSAWEPVAADGHMSDGQRHDYFEREEADAINALVEYLRDNDCEIPRRSIHFHMGTPAEVIVKVGAELDAELIVVGDAARTGLKRWIYGNTVEDVLEDGTTDVMGVVKQDD